jgi:TolB protein
MIPFLRASDSSEKIVVQLSTEKKLLPLYVNEFTGEGFDQSYLNKLKNVLDFDLNHNGMTEVIRLTPMQEKRLKGKSDELIAKELGVFYLVNVKIKDKQISAKLICINSQIIKGVDGIPLTGDLNKDRREIHKFSDLIHKELFGKAGIASTKILYTVRTSQGTKFQSEIFECDYDGSNARQITKSGDYCVTPQYIPPEKEHSAKSFFYVSYATGQPKIFIGSLKDGSSQRFSYIAGNQLMPVSSRQRDKVAFVSDVSGNPDLYLQPFRPETGAFGKLEQIFANPQGTQGSPSFSPDGKQVAFVSNKDGSAKIYLLDLTSKTKTPKLLTKHNQENTAPCFSPDGTKIAYCAKSKDFRQIWVYDLVKQEERQLTEGPLNKENPSFAPNSLHIVFNTTDSQNCELYMINLNQPKTVKISSGSGEKHYPSWEPLSLY